MKRRWALFLMGTTALLLVIEGAATWFASPNSDPSFAAPPIQPVAQPAPTADSRAILQQADLKSSRDKEVAR